mgnify:CR=1 FL=1
MPRNVSNSPRAHGATAKNVSTVTFRYPSGAPTVLLVHGRATEVRARIQRHMDTGKARIKFHDLNSDQERTIILTNVDTWSVA